MRSVLSSHRLFSSVRPLVIGLAACAGLAQAASGQFVPSSTCAAAPAVTANTAGIFQFNIASFTPGLEGDVACLPTSITGSSPGDAWVQYTPSASGIANVQLFDNNLATRAPCGVTVFAGCGGVVVTCSPDFSGGATAVFQAVAGTTYFIRYATRTGITNAQYVARLSGPNPVTPGTVKPFTYQGELRQDGAAVNAPIDIRARLWTLAAGGTQVGGDDVLFNVPVNNGLFTAVLNSAGAFGLGAFAQPGQAIEIAVRPTGSNGAFTTISPRQVLTAAPYAHGVPAGPFQVNNGTVFTTSPVAIGQNAVGNNVIFDVAGRTRLRQGAGQFSSAGTWYNASTGFDTAFVGLQDDSTFGIFSPTLSTGNWFFNVNLQTGAVGIGGAPGVGGSRLGVNGNIRASSITLTGGADIAEPFTVHAAGEVKAEPGMLVIIDADNPGHLRVADRAYDKAVAGIISGAGGISPGLNLTQEGSIADGTTPVAKVGRVYAWVDADANGAVEPGDMLTTSSTPGHAMKASDAAKSHGTVVGKAMTRLEKGRGLVLVLVNLQ